MARQGDEQDCPGCGARIICSPRGTWTTLEPPWIEHHCEPQTAATVKLARAIEEQTWVLKEQTTDATVMEPLTPIVRGPVVPIRRPGPTPAPAPAEQAHDLAVRFIDELEI